MEDADREERTAVGEYMDLVGRRADFLAYLAEEPAEKRDLIDELDHSRSTVDRATNDLQEADLVRYTGGAYETTAVGVVALEQYRTHIDRSGDVRAAREALDPLSPEECLDPAMVVDASVTVVDGPRPYGALEPLRSALAGATRIRALLPDIADSRLVDAYRERAVDGADVELVFGPDLRKGLARQFPGTCRATARAEHCTVYEAPVPPFGVVVTEEDGVASVSVVVYTDCGSVHALLHVGTRDAVGWAENVHESVVAEAEDVTAHLGALDGADRGADSTREESADATDSVVGAAGEQSEGAGAATASWPTQLATEGFLRLSERYFDRRTPGDPATCWRTVLDLPEVAAGYAVDRTRPADDGDDGRLETGDAEATSEPRDEARRTNLTETLIERLHAGEDSVVLGPPGAGKSTVCKSVAHRWYERDLGPVVYRESGQADAVESAAELRSALRDLPGHALVVVEDVTRAEANATLEVARELDGDPILTFLFDARESEWDGADSLPLDARIERYRATVERVRLPDLDATECARFVDRFERVTEVEVPVSPADLLAEIRRDGNASVSAPEFEPDATARRGEVLLLFHRLSRYAVAPADDAPTALVENVEATYRRLATADDPRALEVGVLVNLLNAAGVGVYPEYVHALADDRAEHETIERHLEALQGSVLFSSPAEVTPALAPYEAIHETWSQQFLDRLLDDRGSRRAHGIVGDCLSALLSLADDGDRRRSIEWYFEGSRDRLDRVVADPEGWTGDVLRSVFELGRRRPGLAPLLGTTEHSRVDLPESCSRPIELHCTRWLGQAYVNAGEFDRAAAEFELLVDRAAAAPLDEDRRRKLRADGLRNRGRIAWERGEYDVATEHLTTATDLYETLDDEGGRADCLRPRALVERSRGDLDTARELVSRALDAYRSVGDRRGVADCQQDLGILALDRSDPAAAAEQLGAALSAYERGTDDDRRAGCHINIGVAAKQRGDLTTAGSHYQRARELYRKLGDRHGVADAAHNLGRVQYERGDLDAAAEAYGQALETYREVGDEDGEGTSLQNLGLLAKDRGEFDRAIDRIEAALELDGLEERHAASAVHDLGVTYREAGELARARDRLQESLRRLREVDDCRGVGTTLVELGRIDRRTDDLERAHERLVDGVEACREVGAVRKALDGYRTLIDVAEELDGPRAAETCREAVEFLEASDLDPDLAETVDRLRERCRALEAVGDDEQTAV